MVLELIVSKLKLTTHWKSHQDQAVSLDVRSDKILDELNNVSLRILDDTCA